MTPIFQIIGLISPPKADRWIPPKAGRQIHLVTPIFQIIGLISPPKADRWIPPKAGRQIHLVTPFPICQSGDAFLLKNLPLIPQKRIIASNKK
ncbi:hypothetical protein COY07_03965 [Candidatus Peregrinibacteria bacterium CG_4_10_14_0_2_um_filter_43_11]|nr:MAG: hypothetical protein COY07_03965 [Candidatus Peregrinibacteria bacterium CG_4_10_14_0_2_um_filter_43_11]